MPPPFAREFSPELSEGFYASQLNKINNNLMSEVGRARSEGESSGLVGQAATGSRIGAAVKDANDSLLQSSNDFDLAVADKKFSERMTDEKRSYDDVEARRHEDFLKQMKMLDYQFEIGSDAAERGFERVQGQQGALWGLGTGLLSGAAQGGGAMAAKMAMSDRRLKESIVEIGRIGPVGVYAYRFRGGTGLDLPKGPQVGVLAQEVRASYHEHVAEIRGYLAVDYAGLDAALRRDHGRGL